MKIKSLSRLLVLMLMEMLKHLSVWLITVVNFVQRRMEETEVEEDGRGAGRRRRMEGRPVLCNLTLLLRHQRGTAPTWTPLDERNRVLRSDWLSAVSLAPAPFPGCSCQTHRLQVRITTDVLSRRPASPRATLTQPQNKKACKWECLLCRRVFPGHV